jgi:hypothetical protein
MLIIFSVVPFVTTLKKKKKTKTTQPWNLGSHISLEKVMIWIKTHLKLHTLSLRQNKLSTATIKSLCEILELVPHQLASLDLRACHIGVSSMKHVRKKETKRT